MIEPLILSKWKYNELCFKKFIRASKWKGCHVGEIIEVCDGEFLEPMKTATVTYVGDDYCEIERW